MIENLVNNGRRRYRLRYEMPQVISFVARPSTITNHPSSNPRRRRPTESQWRLTFRGFRTGRPPRSSHHTAHHLRRASPSCAAPSRLGRSAAPITARCGAGSPPCYASWAGAAEFTPGPCTARRRERKPSRAAASQPTPAPTGQRRKPHSSPVQDPSPQAKAGTRRGKGGGVPLFSGMGWRFHANSLSPQPRGPARRPRSTTRRP